MRLAFVVQRYGVEVGGGAELHCRWVAEHLAKYHAVEVLTTCAHDYITWANHYRPGITEVHGLPVRRFRTWWPRDPVRFGRLSQRLFESGGDRGLELRWLRSEGPFAPGLVRYLRRHRTEYDAVILFSYRYYTTYHALMACPQRALLVPTAEPDRVIHLGIFRQLFNRPRAIAYNSVEERDLIQMESGNQEVPGEVIGVGTELPVQTDPARFHQRYELLDPFLLYVGRIDENKGCAALFEYFLRYREGSRRPLKLVLIGNAVMPLPRHPDILALGFLSEQDKFDALAACELLVMPSPLESLSMVTLEAWALGKPVLVNADCPVLKGQSIRSNAGLFFRDFDEFAACCDRLLEQPNLSRALGDNGRRYFHDYYRWEVIEAKYERLLQAAQSGAA
jgi:glycosyltransferase involved in cell wall biosynthesis